jgi:hypothetical protein
VIINVRSIQPKIVPGADQKAEFLLQGVHPEKCGIEVQLPENIRPQGVQVVLDDVANRFWGVLGFFHVTVAMDNCFDVLSD